MFFLQNADIYSTCLKNVNKSSACLEKMATYLVLVKKKPKYLGLVRKNVDISSAFLEIASTYRRKKNHNFEALPTL